MVPILVSPAEPKALWPLGRVSSQPERIGADFCWATKANGLVVVQRKAMPSDLLASIDDGRLQKEIAQSRIANVRVLLLEGRPQWTLDGNLITSWGQPWTRDQHRSLMFSMRAAGMWVEWSDDLADTANVLKGLHRWSRKVRHTALMRRPAARGAWGKPTNREFQSHVVQSLPDVGPELADRIIDTLGMPFGWRVTEKDLTTVHGVGKVKARKIYGCMEPAMAPELNGAGVAE